MKVDISIPLRLDDISNSLILIYYFKGIKLHLIFIRNALTF
ncbi:hypothetical protein [Staphylococcus felis]|nr:hypothetical protein [Staphylococcus felis]